MDDFKVKALEIAELLTRTTDYRDKVGQEHAEARAADIRRVFNILEGRSADANASKLSPTGGVSVPTSR